MSEDGFRSSVYRSFVICNDPKGVAECKTMRKSKTNSKSLESVSETKTMTNGILNHSPSNTGKGKKIDFKPSSSQLNEVCKGARNLNQTIDTYSNGGMRFDHTSKEIAKDLLKGALDLQESLMVLGKLQEASHYMSKFRKKPKEKPKDEKNEEQIRIQKSKSERYADYNHQKGFLKPRTSIDDSSRDCYDELRTVIRDSLARQNLLPPNFHDKPRILDSMVDIPSTSSTQSSTMNFLSFTSSDTSISSVSSKRSKGSNLIAKLMGLEEIPSQQRFISSPKRFEIEKFPVQRRPPFEIDMANVKKPLLDTYNENKEDKRLRDIVETMRYKGLLKGNSSEGSDKRILFEDGPPIVIMKPDVSMKEPKEKDFQNLICKSGNKVVNRGAVDFDEVCRKLREGGTPMRKQGFREFKEKELSDKLKASVSVDRKEKKKKVDKPKLRENEILKSKRESRSHDEQKVSSLREPISRRRSVSPQKSTPPVVIPKNKSPLIHKGGDRKKNQKLVKELVKDHLVEEHVEHKHGEELMEQSYGDVGDGDSTSTITLAQILAREETIVPVDPIKDQVKNTKLETIAESIEEASFLNIHNITLEDECYPKQTKETKLFLRSPSFLKQANELFHTEINSKILNLEPTSPLNTEIANVKLLLEVGNELMLQKKLSTQLIHPPFLTPKTSTISLSLTQLVDEVCQGLDELTKYRENGNEKFIAETLYSILERDMLGSGLPNGAWELGWRHGYCFDDVSQVVGDIENIVFDELIEGMFADSTLLAFCK